MTPSQANEEGRRSATILSHNSIEIRGIQFGKSQQQIDEIANVHGRNEQ